MGETVSTLYDTTNSMGESSRDAARAPDSRPTSKVPKPKGAAEARSNVEGRPEDSQRQHSQGHPKGSAPQKHAQPPVSERAVLSVPSPVDDKSGTGPPTPPQEMNIQQGGNQFVVVHPPEVEFKVKKPQLQEHIPAQEESTRTADVKQSVPQPSNRVSSKEQSKMLQKQKTASKKPAEDASVAPAKSVDAAAKVPAASKKNAKKSAQETVKGTNAQKVAQSQQEQGGKVLNLQQEQKMPNIKQTKPAVEVVEEGKVSAPLKDFADGTTTASTLPTVTGTNGQRLEAKIRDETEFTKGEEAFLGGKGFTSYLTMDGLASLFRSSSSEESAQLAQQENTSNNAFVQLKSLAAIGDYFGIKNEKVA